MTVHHLYADSKVLTKPKFDVTLEQLHTVLHDESMKLTKRFTLLATLLQMRTIVTENW